MPAYLFDLGNSDSGRIGASLRIHGENAEDALATLKAELAQTQCAIADDDPPEDAYYTYVNVYMNGNFIALDAVKRSETEPCERVDCEFCGDYQAVGRDECRECGESTADGNGYLGRCGNCADKRERARP